MTAVSRGSLGSLLENIAEGSVLEDDTGDRQKQERQDGCVQHVEIQKLQEFEELLQDARNQFKSHDELFHNQADLARSLLGQLFTLTTRRSTNVFQKDFGKTSLFDLSSSSKTGGSRGTHGSQLSASRDTHHSFQHEHAPPVTTSVYLSPVRESGVQPVNSLCSSAAASKISAHTQCTQVTSILTDATSHSAISELTRLKMRKSYAKKEDTVSGTMNKIVEALGMDRSNSDRVFGELHKRKTHKTLDQREYDVKHLYHQRGVAQAIARSDFFANFTLLVVVGNAVFIGIDVDRNDADVVLNAELGFQVCEYAFSIYFIFEWFVRLCAFQFLSYCLRDGWFKFDTVLVVMMLLESIVLPLFMKGSGTHVPTSFIKLVRVLRLARMARLMRELPELVAMIKGVRMAFRAVGSALLMVLLLVYIFSIIMFLVLRDGSHSHPGIGTKDSLKNKALLESRFGSLTVTMWTLLVDGAFLDNYGLISRLLLDLERGWFPFSIMLIFMLASAVTVMNMLIGVLCAVVNSVAAAEKENTDVRLVKETLLVMLLELDTSGDGKISQDEMQGVLENVCALGVLDSLEVDVTHLMEQVEILFDDSSDGNLTITCIMELILMLRGSRTPTMKDILHVQTFQRWTLSKLDRWMNAKLMMIQDVLFSTSEKITNLEEQVNAKVRSLEDSIGQMAHSVRLLCVMPPRATNSMDVGIMNADTRRTMNSITHATARDELMTPPPPRAAHDVDVVYDI